MSFTFVEEIHAGGAPLVIADAATAPRWRGRLDDGSGVVVEYTSTRHADLPTELRGKSATRAGRVRRRFATLVEARTFERRVVAALAALHPGAVRPPRVGVGGPGIWYVGETRAFAVEVRFTSMFDRVAGSLASEVAVVALEKAARARVVLVPTTASARTVVAADEAAGRLVVAQPHAAGDARALPALVKALPALSVPKPRQKLPFAAGVLVFAAAFAASELAPFDPEKSGALRARGHGSAAVGAFVRLPAATYALSFAEDVELDVAAGGLSAQVLWLQRRK